MNSDLPQLTHAARLGEQGVAIMSRIAMEAFGWLFKRNHQEHDFGIDGQLEIVTTTGQLTGQFLAAQIKCGKSFFVEQDKWGYVYRGEQKHFNYLANYPVPVLICICDPETQECYWAPFNPLLIEPTDKGWKLTIPFGNTLKDSKQAVLELLPDRLDAAKDLQKYWEFNRSLTESPLVQWILDPLDVASRDLTWPRYFFDRMRFTKELAHRCQGKVELMFSGYDDDPRELWEMDDIRDYVRQLDAALPELLFFLRREQPTFGLMTFALCQTEVQWVDDRSTKTVTRSASYDPLPIADFLHRHWAGLNELAEWTGMDERELEAISRQIVKYLHLLPVASANGA